MSLEYLAQRFPELTAEEGGLEPTVTVPASSLTRLMQALRDEPRMRFDLLACATAIDYPPERIRLAYHLVSLEHKHRLCVHVDLERSHPVVDSLVPLWAGACFFEREIYDLFGVTFTGHPDLRRILLDDDFVGWPLRKDFTSPDLIHRPER